MLLREGKPAHLWKRLRAQEERPSLLLNHLKMGKAKVDGKAREARAKVDDHPALIDPHAHVVRIQIGVMPVKRRGKIRNMIGKHAQTTRTRRDQNPKALT